MTAVTPMVGYYAVRMADPEGIRTHLVGKDKHCTCGGNAKRQCSHIRAVAEHLKSGGSRAPAGTAESLHDSKPSQRPRQIPKACPICGASLSHSRNGFWRCSKDSSHYWRWRAEQNGAAIRKFLTQPHPVKRGAFYEMSDEERQEFLLRVHRRMYSNGYSPHGGNGHE